MTENYLLSDGTTVYRLANLINVSFSRSNSDGARWLMDVAEGWNVAKGEAIEYGREIDDARHEYVDGAVPIYTSTVWTVFADLYAWEHSEDVADDYGTLPTDMTDAAKVILYWLADRLTYALDSDENGDD